MDYENLGAFARAASSRLLHSAQLLTRRPPPSRRPVVPAADQQPAWGHCPTACGDTAPSQPCLGHPSVHQPTAADVEDGSGDEGGRVRGEEQRGTDHLGWVGGTAEWGWRPRCRRSTPEWTARTHGRVHDAGGDDPPSASGVGSSPTFIAPPSSGR
jgi:hypothetical protein